MSEENGDAVTVYLYGVIGQRPSLYYYSEDKSEDITDMEFLKLVRKYEKEGKKRLDIRINSPGGSTLHLDGIVAQMQTTTMEVHTWVDGVAASAAADIWLAAKKENRHVARNGKVMIHAPIDICYGNAKAMEQCAEKLHKFEDAYVSQMAAGTGKTEDEVRSKYYDGEDHWMTAKDCEQEGLIVKMDDYEAEKMPAAPEKMTQADLFDYFEENKKEGAVGIFKQLYNLAFPEKAVHISPKIDEEMNIENIQAALKSGEIKEEELLQALGAQKTATPAPATPPAAPEKSLQEQITDAIKAAMKPLEDKIAAQEAEIQKLGDEPGAGPARVPSGGDPNDEEGAEDILKQLNASLTEAAKKGEAVRVGGYGTGAPVRR